MSLTKPAGPFLSATSSSGLVISWLSQNKALPALGMLKKLFDVVKKKEKKKSVLLFVCSLCVVWLFRKLLLILSFYLLFWNGHLWHLFINMILKVRISKRWSIDIWGHPLPSLIYLKDFKTLCKLYTRQNIFPSQMACSTVQV